MQQLNDGVRSWCQDISTGRFTCWSTSNTNTAYTLVYSTKPTSANETLDRLKTRLDGVYGEEQEVD
jgi:hypothetical protein